jgi:hypothetical protein
MDDQDLFDEAYEGNNSTMLVIETDGESVKLKLKMKKLPGAKQSGTIAAKRKPGGKYVIDFGMGSEEYGPDELPNPIKKLIDSKGGGPNGNAATLPPVKSVIRNYLPRTYPEYASDWRSRRYSGKAKDAALTERVYHHVAKLYLDQMGVPLYL